MATLLELSTLIAGGDTDFENKLKAAIVKTAVSVAFESDQTANHANRLKWSVKAVSDVNGQMPKVRNYVVAANAAETLAAILALSDATLQSHVDASLAILADGS
jgi:hypothetical protein